MNTPTNMNIYMHGLRKKEVGNSLIALKNNKAHGSDGIPGESYKILRKSLTKPSQISQTTYYMGPDYLLNGQKEQ